MRCACGRQRASWRATQRVTHRVTQAKVYKEAKQPLSSPLLQHLVQCPCCRAWCSTPSGAQAWMADGNPNASNLGNPRQLARVPHSSAFFHNGALLSPALSCRALFSTPGGSSARTVQPQSTSYPKVRCPKCEVSPHAG